MKKTPNKPIVQLGFKLKGKNANAFILIGLKEQLKDYDRKLRKLATDLKDLAPEAPLRVEELIHEEIKKTESEKKALMETIKTLESK